MCMCTHMHLCVHVCYLCMSVYVYVSVWICVLCEYVCMSMCAYGYISNLQHVVVDCIKCRL